MILNRQRKYAADLPALRAYVRSLRQVLGLGGREFNICLLADREMARLNAAYRFTPRPTDVLSFPWKGDQNGKGLRGREFNGFLGDVAISVETARRNACLEGHSTFNEIRWLVLHGVLHLLGYDHERDGGEMTRLEHALRERLGIAGRPSARRSERRSPWPIRQLSRRSLDPSRDGPPDPSTDRLRNSAYAAGRRERWRGLKRAKGPHG